MISHISRDLPSPDRMAEELAGDTLAKVPGEELAGLLAPTDADDICRRDYGERYEPLDVLGRGGQGVVLRARDTLLNREVAIKAVRPPYQPIREQSIRNEARCGGALEHPNILPTYDLGEDETGSPFFVMKKLGGTNLEDLLKIARDTVNRDRAAVRHTARGHVLPEEAVADYSTRRLLNIFQQVCHAVEYAHSRGVYHLDLKPQNIALGSFGEVYVLDWGFASSADTPTKVLAGTPMFLAPEYMEGSPPGARCDVYALGVILYRLLTFRYPRDLGDLTWGEYRKRWREFPVIPPRLRDPGIPRDLEAIVLKALADDPEKRYASVRELDRDLERFLDVLPVSAYREGAWSRAGKFLRRHRWIGIAVAAAAVLTLAGTGVAWNNRRLGREAQAAEESARRAERLREAAAENLKAQEENAERERALRRRVRFELEQANELLERSRDAVRTAAGPEQRLELMRPAIERYTSAIGLDKDSAEARYGLARANHLAGLTREAIGDYRAAYALDNSFLLACYYAGRLLLQENQPEDAADEFARLEKAAGELARRDHGDGVALGEYADLGYAWLHLVRGEAEQALARCDRVEAANPGVAEVWEIRARARLIPGSPAYDRRRAEADYSRFLDAGHGRARDYAQRGELRYQSYRFRGDPADLGGALDDWNEALARDPACFPALLGRARIRLERAERLDDDARHARYAAVDARREADRVRTRDLRVALDANRPEEADRVRAQADTLRKTAADADYLARKFQDDAAVAFVNAAADLDAALAIQPRSAPALFERARLRDARGDRDGALRDYDDAVLLAPDDGELLAARGLFRLRGGQFALADADLSAALERLGDHADARTVRYRRGLLRYADKRPGEAEDDFLRLMGVAPGGGGALPLPPPVAGEEAPPPGVDARAALGYWLARRARGQTDADGLLRRWGDREANPARRALASYYLGEIDYREDGEVLRMASDAAERCEAEFFLGAYALARGDPERAAAHFDACGEGGAVREAESALSGTLLARARETLAAERAKAERQAVESFTPTLPSGASVRGSAAPPAPVRPVKPEPRP